MSGSSNKADRDKPFRLLLLVPIPPRLSAVCAICCRAPIATISHRGRAEIRKSWLRESELGTDGLIALSGAHLGEIGLALIQQRCRAGRFAGSASWASFSLAVFISKYSARARPNTEAVVQRSLHAGFSPAFAGGRDASGAVPESGRLSRARGARMHRRGLCARRSPPAEAFHANSSTSKRRPRWRSCSPTCRRRLPTPSRSPSAAT